MIDGKIKGECAKKGVHKNSMQIGGTCNNDNISSTNNMQNINGSTSN